MLDYKPSINHELNPIHEQMTGFKQKGFLSPLQMIYVYIYIYIYIYDFYFKCITSDDRIGSKN